MDKMQDAIEILKEYNQEHIIRILEKGAKLDLVL